ncbi:tyrosine-type recombinase/integrase [Paraburkholderia tuberum]|uniref:Site-specific recombinase XerD n=1 Tax=Paraburkholderia tuberum TaxID=157910 RepID=A0A1H1KM12_9BURK|nr:tyrosine-type recombinase/integrase [Paraburkholderia tuberum]SDR63050.1 Site-specific recombinase XerD [Paraburkholderia tuberum]
MSTLSKLLDDYLTTRRSLGFKLTCEGTGLRTFVSFMERQQAVYITTKLALAWAQKPRLVQPAQWNRRLGFVRSFARYCSAFDARTQVPPTDLLPFKYVRPEPYFFTDHDIERLLQATLKLRPENGLRRWTFRCLYGLLSVSGLRSCEARNLFVDDVNLVDGVLTIRSSKFGKSRLVVLHPSVVAVLTGYLERRQHFFGSRSHLISHVFVNDCGSPLSSEQMLDTFQRLMKRIGVTANEAGRKPHLHDLRHHFAMQALLRWYRDDEEIERRLPALSAYLGHVEVRDTYWYLSARPELLQLARQRLERYWEQTS